MSKMIKCIGCKALVPDIDGPAFRYPNSGSPGCWMIFGKVMAKEFGEWQYPEVHRLTVDAYAAQHPGDNTPQTRQSVSVHLLAIYLVRKKGLKVDSVPKLMQLAIAKHKDDFKWLLPPANLGDITVVDIAKVETLQEHIELVNSWADSVWEAWSEYHPAIIDLSESINI